jgi:hypothetical protein
MNVRPDTDVFVAHAAARLREEPPLAQRAAEVERSLFEFGGCVIVGSAQREKGSAFASSRKRSRSIRSAKRVRVFSRMRGVS